MLIGLINVRIPSSKSNDIPGICTCKNVTKWLELECN